MAVIKGYIKANTLDGMRFSQILGDIHGYIFTSGLDRYYNDSTRGKGWDYDNAAQTFECVYNFSVKLPPKSQQNLENAICEAIEEYGFSAKDAKFEWSNGVRLTFRMRK